MNKTLLFFILSITKVLAQYNCGVGEQKPIPSHFREANKHIITQKELYQ